MHASYQCDLVVHGGADNSPAESVLAPAAIPMLSAPINVIGKRTRGYKELPGSLSSMTCTDIAENQLSRAVHSRLPTSNTKQAQPKVLHRTASANRSCPDAQIVSRNLLLRSQNRAPEYANVRAGHILVWKPANNVGTALCWCAVPMTVIYQLEE